jgi:hypothetical protein
MRPGATSRYVADGPACRAIGSLRSRESKWHCAALTRCGKDSGAVAPGQRSLHGQGLGAKRGLKWRDLKARKGVN